MLKQIQVDSENPFVIPFIGASPRDSLLLQKITGLGPPDIDLFIGDYARDGGTYQGRRVNKRPLQLIFTPNPDPALFETITGLREILYRAFLNPQVDSDEVRLVFTEDDGRVRYLTGYTEKHEPNFFDEDTSIPISLICPDPYIRDIDYQLYENDSGWSSFPFYYGGTAENGIEVEVYVNTRSSELNLDLNGKIMQVFANTSNFRTYEAIYISTVPGFRALRRALASDVSDYRTANPSATMREVWDALTAMGQTSALLGGLTSASIWPKLHVQSNIIKIHGPSTSDGNFSIRKLRFQQIYWGL